MIKTKMIVGGVLVLIAALTGLGVWANSVLDARWQAGYDKANDERDLAAMELQAEIDEYSIMLAAREDTVAELHDKVEQANLEKANAISTSYHQSTTIQTLQQKINKLAVELESTDTAYVVVQPAAVIELWNDTNELRGNWRDETRTTGNMEARLRTAPYTESDHRQTRAKNLGWRRYPEGDREAHTSVHPIRHLREGTSRVLPGTRDHSQ